MPGGARTLRRAALDGALYFGLVFGVLALLFLPFYPGLLSARRAANESWALHSIKMIHQCAATYREHHSNLGFPINLSLLGPAADNCLDEEARVADRKRGYQFTYGPSAGDRTGSIKTYIISARPIGYGATGERSFFSDESGVIYATGKDRAATVQDPPI